VAADRRRRGFLRKRCHRRRNFAAGYRAGRKSSWWSAPGLLLVRWRRSEPIWTEPIQAALIGASPEVAVAYRSCSEIERSSISGALLLPDTGGDTGESISRTLSRMAFAPPRARLFC
jgi:hypothetical protein